MHPCYYSYLISIFQKTQTKKKMNHKVLDYDYALVSPHYWKQTYENPKYKKRETNKFKNRK